MPSFRIRLARDGAEFEAEGTREFVEKMLALHWATPGGEHKTPAPKKGSPSEDKVKKPQSADAKGLSVAEFIRRVGGAKKHTDLVLLFGYYLEKYAGLENFAAADVNNAYYEAKLDRSNTSQMLIQNIRAGRMMEAKGGSEGRRQYRLTRSGEEAVAEMLQGATAAE
jgi:hypothetical protein